MSHLGLVLVLMGAFGSIANASPNYTGIWLDKEEAQELRSTGKLESLCIEVRKDPKAQIVNTRLIKTSGETFLFDPRVGTVATAKLGTVDFATGRFTLTPIVKKQMGPGTVRLKVAGETLTFLFKSGRSEMAMDYLRSSQEEALKYFAALEACKTSIR